MSRIFNRADRELVELALDLIASGDGGEYALSRAAQRLRDEGRSGVRFVHVLRLEGDITPGSRHSPNERFASLRRLLATFTGPTAQRSSR